MLDRRPADDLVVLVDRDDVEPVTVRTSGYDDPLATLVDGLQPGYVLDATLAWSDGDAAFADLAVTERTLLTFVDAAEPMFEVALDCWEEARSEGLAVNSTPTRNADAEVNGALYVFAEQSGERDVFAELRDGRLPLEPLLERTRETEDAAEGPREVFVLRPTTHEFVAVYVVLRKGSILADTVRDTYDCPRPAEPLADA